MTDFYWFLLIFTDFKISNWFFDKNFTISIQAAPHSYWCNKLKNLKVFPSILSELTRKYAPQHVQVNVETLKYGTLSQILVKFPELGQSGQIKKLMINMGFFLFFFFSFFFFGMPMQIKCNKSKLVRRHKSRKNSKKYQLSTAAQFSFYNDIMGPFKEAIVDISALSSEYNY